MEKVFKVIDWLFYGDIIFCYGKRDVKNFCGYWIEFCFVGIDFVGECYGYYGMVMKIVVKCDDVVVVGCSVCNFDCVFYSFSVSRK